MLRFAGYFLRAATPLPLLSDVMLLSPFYHGHYYFIILSASGATYAFF